MGANCSCGSPAGNVTGELQVSKLPPRPEGAVGPFLRLISINDSYKLENYPMVASAVLEARKAAKSLDCVVTSHMNGDFLSPCTITSLDGGKAMMEGMNKALIDYACLGNHEFDMGAEQLAKGAPMFKGAIINSNGEVPEIADFARHCTVKVGEKLVAFAGLCTGDPTIYTASHRPTMTPFLEASAKVWEDVKKAGSCPDILIPMTHQLITEDRQLAQDFSKHATLAGRVPVILGGHEHDVFNEVAADSLIVKAGLDAENIFVVDVWWTADKALKTQRTMLPASTFAADQEAAEWVKKQQEFVQKSMSAGLTLSTKALSSKGTREGESSMATFLLTMVKRSLQAQGVELALINGGGIRGQSEYPPNATITMGDLYKEMPFTYSEAVVDMEGSVIAAAVKASRDGTGERPGFLHLDETAEVDSYNQVTKIDGKPFDAKKTYKVVLTRALLTGLNEIKPLIEYGKQHAIPDEEACPQAKDLIVQLCMKDSWRKLLGFGEWDLNGDGKVGPTELSAALEKCFAEMDRDKNGFADRAEIQAFLEKKGNVGKDSLISLMMSSVDANSDNKVSIKELASIVQ